MTVDYAEVPPVDSSSSIRVRLPLTEIARLDRTGRNGKPAHVAKYHRMIRRGVALRDGSRLYLAAVRDSAGWLTSLADLADFRDRLTTDRLGREAGSDPGASPAPAKPATPSPAPVRRTARQRDEACQRAGRALAAAGW